VKRILIIVYCVIVFLVLMAWFAISNTRAPNPSNLSAIQTCNLSTYKTSAQPLMQEFSNIVKQLEIRDASSRTKTKSSLESLLIRINQVKCKSDFPLKHETLVYSVKHMIDAIDYADKGDYAEMNYSIEKSLLNVETFQDWSIDTN